MRVLGRSRAVGDPAHAGKFLHRSWEISAVPGATTPGNSGKAKSHTPEQPAVEKSDAFIVCAEQRIAQEG